MESSQQFENKIKRQYVNPNLTGSFSGIDSFIKHRKINQPKKDVERVLLSIPAYYQHRFLKTKFKRRRVFVPFINYQLMIDLADVSKYAKENRGTKFLLVSIDSFSRYLRVVALKDKSSKSVLNGLKKIIKAIPDLKYVVSDLGKEFIAKNVQDFFKSRNIIWFSLNSGLKANLCERVIRTLMTKIASLMTAKKSQFYLKSLPLLVNGYNATIHSSIGIAPKDVTEKNQYDIFRYLYRDLINDTKLIKPKFQLFAKVRISLLKSLFEKGYSQRVSSRSLRITKVIKSQPPTYYLTEEDGQAVLGAFYESEVILVPENGTFKAGEKAKVNSSVFRSLEESGLKNDQLVIIKELINIDPPVYKINESDKLIYEFELQHVQK
jgi:hypothetical protein